jgi:hypothetical protein
VKSEAAAPGTVQIIYGDLSLWNENALGALKLVMALEAGGVPMIKIYLLWNPTQWPPMD